MNDEIKEILHEMKQMCDVWVKVDGNMKSYNQDQIHKIYEYITNLQQENERLKELDENYPIEEELAEAYRREEDYKSRIEKAVEYIKQSINESQLIFGWNVIQRYHDNEMKELIDILNGRSDE